MTWRNLVRLIEVTYHTYKVRVGILHAIDGGVWYRSMFLIYFYV